MNNFDFYVIVSDATPVLMASLWKFRLCDGLTRWLISTLQPRLKGAGYHWTRMFWRIVSTLVVVLDGCAFFSNYWYGEAVRQ